MFWSSPPMKMAPRQPAPSELPQRLHIIHLAQHCGWYLKYYPKLHRAVIIANFHLGIEPFLLILQTALLCRWFCQWLEESSKDFRVGAEALKGLRYAVFGCGNSLYAGNFNKASSHARHLHKR